MQKKSIAGRKLLCYSPWLKRLLIMKMIAILLLVVGLTTSYAESDAQTAKINLKFTNGTVKDVLEEIEHQTNLSFMYDNDVFKVNRQISIEAENETLKSVVDKLISGENLKYEMVNRYIVITSTKETPANQQGKKVTGKVTDSNGGSLPGVSVVVKGTTTGVTTDNSGSFSLSNIPENATLQFSFVGMKNQETIVGGKTTINVTLTEEAIGLEEVVAIGYGTQKKRELTGAVGSISQEDLATIPITRFDQALQGRIAGVNITQSGQPGGDVNIRIRGIGTLNNNSPLIVIDGIPVFGDNGLKSLNPNDIKSIEVLKDGASSAIYGTRAANGVVIVTTKRGKSGMAKIEYNGVYSIQTVANKLNVLNGEQYALLQNEARAAQGVDPLTPDWWDPANIEGAANTNWQNQIFRIAPMKEHSLTVSGGTEKANYLVSGNYLDQKGVIKQSDFKRYSLRVNTDAKVLNIINIGTSLLFSNTTQNLRGNGSIVNTAMDYSPLIPVNFQDGTWGASQGDKDLYSGGINPVASLDLGTNANNNYGVLANFFSEIEILKGLKYRFSYSINLIDGRNNSFMPSYNHGPSTFASQASVSVSNSRRMEYIAENILSYNHTFNQKHDLSLTAVYSGQETKFNSETGSATGLISNSTPYLTDNTGIYNVNSEASGFSLLSYVGRANYSYDGKYLFSATVRQDGSSRFGKNNPWGTFPAFSAGWRISQEAFMSGLDFISDMKLRGSWGKSGNQEIGNYAFLASLGNNFNYVLGSSQTLASGVGPISLENPDLKWETSTQTNIGIDLALFDSKFTFSANYYYKRTNDILLQVPIPRSSGVAVYPTQNRGSMENKGLEFEMGYRKKINDFMFEVAGNISTNQNKVLSLVDGNSIIDGTIVGAGLARGGEGITITREGVPIGSFYGYIMDGIFQNRAEIDNAPSQGGGTRPGDVKFLNIDDSNNLVDVNDRTIIGNPFPDFTYGLTLNFSYKAVELNMFFQGVQGNEIYNGVRAIYANMYDLGNNLTEVQGRWRGEGTSNTVPRAIKFDPNQNGRVSTRWIEDGSYMRLKNLTLGYNLPNSLLEKLNIQKAKIFATAINVFTLTKYTGIDPEISERNNNSKFAGIDFSTYPFARTITFGINVTF